jgi:hypothetical protein
LGKSFTIRKTLSVAGAYVLRQVEAAGKPVLSDFHFSLFVARAREVSKIEKLRLRDGQTLLQDFNRLKKNLIASSKIASDPDYRKTSICRVLSIPDLSAEEVICLVDPLAYISHLSAMQRWGLTLRVSKSVLISQPNLTLASGRLREMMEQSGVDFQSWPIHLSQVQHPHCVRKMPVSVNVTERFGISNNSPGSFSRVASVGQTFADMVEAPDLCGGMIHVLNAWESHAALYLPMIVEAVDTFCGDLGKSRAGYILDERLGLGHPLIAKWKANSIFGDRRKLDPSRAYGLNTSRTWNLSINV